MKTRFIVNPRSGASRGAIGPVRSFAAAHGADVVLTERPQHASELSARARDEGIDLIVAVGGDGTMNEIAAPLVGTRATLGLIPCGSGNGLGRELGIHGSIPRALEILRSGRSVMIDSGLAAGHPFFTAAGLGFEAEVAHRFNGLKNRGLQGYVTSGVALFREFRPSEFTIEGERRETVRVFTLAVGNAAQYGNNARIAPGARLDDGLLNLTAVPPFNAFSAPPLLWRLFRGTLGDDLQVRRQVGARFTVIRPAAGLIHTDGESHFAEAAVEFAVRPSSLRIRVPA